MNKGNQNYTYQLRTKLQHKLENKIKVPIADKAMKIKLTNMLRGKERRKRMKG